MSSESIDDFCYERETDLFFRVNKSSRTAIVKIQRADPKTPYALFL